MPDYYCCFVDPAESREKRELADLCPDCGRAYGFPGTDLPEQIAGYRIKRFLGRGFYAATYLAEAGMLDQKYVLKVVPEKVYAHFNKDFEAESRLHAEVAQQSQHLVGIRDVLSAHVDFNGTTLRCHVAVLDFVDGPKLADFVKSEALTANAIAQVAVDLLQLLKELEARERYHNDLHDRNVIVERLSPQARRADAVDEGIRAVAIDLGSLADASNSSDRLGDLHSVAHHLFALSRILLAEPDEASEIDYRLAGQLEEIGRQLAPDALKQRTPDFDQFIEMIRDAVRFVASPWVAPDHLRRFNEAYNAQTLHPWFVPQLLVDPDGEWLAAVSTPEPRVITGMRGCGKTMLLRSLQFHARAHAAQLEHPGATERQVAALGADGYVGLYVSCNRLLDALEDPRAGLHEPYARLFLAYAREALRAARHLREIDRGQVAHGFHRELASVVDEYLEMDEDLVALPSETALERRLQRMSASLERGESRYRLNVNHTIAFGRLAEAVRAMSPVWQNATVLLLLDDVSTRHLKRESVSTLLRTLLFPSDTCAFKLTTEFQTVEEILRSPGNIEVARPGRDYELFDLGAAVNERLRTVAQGRAFIAEILEARRRHFRPHPAATVEAVLGRTSLSRIAERIVTTRATARDRKAVYHGLEALTAVCVGDIGDVIYLYEMMLRASQSKPKLPIPANVQHRCFREYCARRLYHLNRRDKTMRDFAMTFAQASNDLLVKSHRDRLAGTENRLRQYSKLYVRITTGDTARQWERIRDLVDAGVFVFEGGIDAPRSKTTGGDPMQQFVLTYRKLYGLSQYIGLSDRDRFELSGAELEEWLDNPERGREILIRSPVAVDPAPLETEEDAADTDSDALATGEEDVADAAPTLFRDLPGEGDPEEPEHAPDLADSYAVRAIAEARPLRLGDLPANGVAGVVFGLGFEERTLESARRVLDATQPAAALLVRYDERGHGDEIERLVRSRIDSVEVVDYRGIAEDLLALPAGPLLVDVTGLAKPALFRVVREALTRDRQAFIAHTFAERHYPLSEEIERVFEAEREQDPYQQLSAQDRVWAGEAGPYSFDKLLGTDADDSRRRLLCASASPKHQRLLSLIGDREYDRIELVAPSGDSARSRLARLAAEVTAQGAESAHVTEMDSNDLQGVLRQVGELYQQWYVRSGFDFELALTGSKMHGVAFAAACVSLRITQCWYVRPRSFDPARFTAGVGHTQCYGLQLPDRR